jgi:hypothetical protein
MMRRTSRFPIDRVVRLFRPWPPALALAVLFGGGAALAHDPFEITTDAHVSGELLTLHTTLALPSATRMCFSGKEALRTVDPLAFGALSDRYEACARDFVRVTAGGVALPVTSARVALTAENDVEMWTAHPRPTKSPLSFDAVRLRRLVAPAAGAVLTVTGAHTFLGQALLRPATPTFEVAIGPDAEAPQPPTPTPPPPVTGWATYALAAALTVVSIGLVWLIRGIVNRLTSRP